VVGLGTGVAVLSLLEPVRRARARRALDRAGEAARETGERVGAAAAELTWSRAIGRRPGVLGAFLLGRALLGGGLLRIPFGLLGLSTMARAASTSERAQTVLDAATRGICRAAAALRSLSRAAAERAASGAGGPVIVGPDANPAT
jgi:hypothetical protein